MIHDFARKREGVAPRALRAFVTRIECGPIPQRADRFGGQFSAEEGCVRSVKRVHVNRLEYGASDSCGQATKGTWGMSWRQKPMKGVEDCDKPGVVVKRALIPGFPN